MSLGRLLVLLFAAALLPAQEPPFDLIIANGRIVDGTGNAWFYGDLAIRGDHIARIVPRGMLEAVGARERLDAKGLVVAPGFIDIQGASQNPLLTGDGARHQSRRTGHHH
jgi:dihydroorotase/N-acyl-D-amino-acid deacylase